jgi:SgrR family transcriptional regulator
MQFIDRKLVYLKDYLNKNAFSKRGVAEYLEVTERHLTRLLKQWNDSGVITYIQGRGRGNHSTVKFNMDIENIIINEYVKNIERYSIEDINEVLNLPISKTSKQFIKASLETRLFSKKFINGENGETLVDYYPKLPDMYEMLNGIADCDFSFMTLVLNVTNRLYETDEDGKIINGIVRYDEWHDNTFIIYLRKDVQFYNGENICANMVAENLERILEQEYMRQFKKYILSISVLDPFKLAIKMTGRYEAIKYVLTRMESSIFLIRDEKLYTIGPYYIDHYDNDTIYLRQNPYYFGEKSDINYIEMTSNPTKYSQYIQKKFIGQYSFKK